MRTVKVGPCRPCARMSPALPLLCSAIGNRKLTNHLMSLRALTCKTKWGQSHLQSTLAFTRTQLHRSRPLLTRAAISQATTASATMEVDAFIEKLNNEYEKVTDAVSMCLHGDIHGCSCPCPAQSARRVWTHIDLWQAWSLIVLLHAGAQGVRGQLLGH